VIDSVIAQANCCCISLVTAHWDLFFFFFKSKSVRKLLLKHLK